MEDNSSTDTSSTLKEDSVESRLYPRNMDRRSSMVSDSFAEGESSSLPNMRLKGCEKLKTTTEPHFRKDYIRCLPVEVALRILSFLDSEDLCRAAQTSRYWQTVAEDNLMWREKCKESGFLCRQLPAPWKPKGPCYSRSNYKSLYLRLNKIDNNWRKKSKPKIYRCQHTQYVKCLQVCGDKVFCGSSIDSDDYNGSGDIEVWSVSKNECLAVLSGHISGVLGCHATEDGRYLASASYDPWVKIWDTDTGECLHTLQGHTDEVTRMALQGTTLVTSSFDTTLRV